MKYSSLIGILALLILGVAFVFFARSLQKKSKSKKSIDTKYDTNTTGPGINTQAVSEEEGSRMIAMRKRLVALSTLVTGVISILFFKVWSMQVVSSDEYVELAEDNRTRVIPTKAPRGRILDRNGEVIVGNRASLVVMADRDVLKDTMLMKRLANVLGMPFAAVKRNIRDTSQGASAARMVAMDVNMKTVSYIVEHAAQFPKISIESRSVRAYPYTTLAAHLLGYTGPISQEELERAKNNPDASMNYQMGDVIGKTGIEAQYESVLQGVPGSQTIQVDAHGKLVN
ncbi:MAG: penicillin-binding protein 2, partial [Coriobacteriia bacterium]|nr:penicillin-binding protein 2 [Coriobacteriia bacterium]